MRLTVGAVAPEFEARTWDGNTVRLTDYRGRKLWLAFFRYASCPLCNLRVHDIIVKYPGLTAGGLAIVGVVQSPPASVREYMATQHPPFPLIADPGEKLYAQYGLEQSVAAWISPGNLGRVAKAMRTGFMPGRMEGTKTRIPADFLIGPDGRIEALFYGELIGDHIPLETVERFGGASASA